MRNYESREKKNIRAVPFTAVSLPEAITLYSTSHNLFQCLVVLYKNLLLAVFFFFSLSFNLRFTEKVRNLWISCMLALKVKSHMINDIWDIYPSINGLSAYSNIFHVSLIYTRGWLYKFFQYLFEFILKTFNDNNTIVLMSLLIFLIIFNRFADGFRDDESREMKVKLRILFFLGKKTNIMVMQITHRYLK